MANNFVNILATAIATVLAVDLIGEPAGPVIATFAVTAIVLVAGEITPKTLAARHPEQYGLAVAPVLWWIIRVLEPISKVFRAISNRILRLVGGDGDNGRAVTEADVRALALMGEQSGEIDQVEREIIDALFHVADRPVREVMTPRVDIRSLETPITMAAIRRVVSETGHSRYPVIPPVVNSTRPSACLSVKDLFRIAGRRRHRSGSSVSSEKPSTFPKALPSCRCSARSVARGSASPSSWTSTAESEGMVTVKDILSELVGELQDEFDPGIPAAAPHRTTSMGSRWFDVRRGTQRGDRARGYPRVRTPPPADCSSSSTGTYPSRAKQFRWPTCDSPSLQMDRNRIARLRVEADRRGMSAISDPASDRRRSGRPAMTDCGPRSLGNIVSTLRDVAQLGSAHRSGR